MSRLRAARRIAMIAAVLLVCLPLHVLFRRLRGHSPWARRFLRTTAEIVGADMTVEGVPLKHHALIVANHRSWLDIVVLAGASGCSFVAKAEIKRWPVIGWLGRAHDTVFIERTRRSDARGQADALRAALGRGQAVAMFPEGGTNPTPAILPFKASLFAAVCPPTPGVRVQPVLIDYGTAAREIAWPEEESAPENALRILGRRGRFPVRIAFRAPIDPGALPDRKAVASAARAALEDSPAIA